MRYSGRDKASFTIFSLTCRVCGAYEPLSTTRLSSATRSGLPAKTAWLAAVRLSSVCGADSAPGWVRAGLAGGDPPLMPGVTSELG